MKIIKTFTLMILVMLTSCSGTTSDIQDNNLSLNNTSSESLQVDDFLGVSQAETSLDDEIITQIEEEVNNIDNTDDLQSLEDILLDTETLLNSDIEEDTSQLSGLENTTEEDIASLVDTLFAIEN